jgi:hypothetical protein
MNMDREEFCQLSVGGALILGSPFPTFAQKPNSSIPKTAQSFPSNRSAHASMYFDSARKHCVLAQLDRRFLHNFRVTPGSDRGRCFTAVGSGYDRGASLGHY